VEEVVAAKLRRPQVVMAGVEQEEPELTELGLLALQIPAVAAVAVEIIMEAQAAPALLSSSTPYQAKPYLRSKALLLGNARQVLLALTILWLAVEVGVGEVLLEQVAAQVD
jgi:hypothetical protein